MWKSLNQLGLKRSLLPLTARIREARVLPEREDKYPGRLDLSRGGGDKVTELEYRAIVRGGALDAKWVVSVCAGAKSASANGTYFGEDGDGTVRARYELRQTLCGGGWLWKSARGEHSA